MAGYYAAAPDLYAVNGRRPAALERDRVTAVEHLLDTQPGAWRDPAARDAAIAGLPAAERAGVRETMGLLLNPDRPIERYLGMLRGTCAALRRDPHCDGWVGSVGYCFGGLLSARLAGVEPELGAAVIFYGA